MAKRKNKQSENSALKKRDGKIVELENNNNNNKNKNKNNRNNNNNNRSRLNNVLSLACGVLIGTFSLVSDAALNPEKNDRTVEEILTRNCSIERVIEPKSENVTGNIYLIGQEHYVPSYTKEGIDFNDKTPKRTLFVQSEICKTLYDLSSEADLELVIGEGLRSNERFIDYREKEFSDDDARLFEFEIKNKEKLAEYFKKRPIETGYTMLEMMRPSKIRLFGADESKELDEINLISRKIADNIFKYAPRREDVNNPIKMQALANANRELEKRRDYLNDERSIITLTDGIKKADELKERDFAIVIGMMHIPLMVQEYNGNRRMYVLRPKSIISRPE